LNIYFLNFLEIKNLIFTNFTGMFNDPLVMKFNKNKIFEKNINITINDILIRMINYYLLACFELNK